MEKCYLFAYIAPNDRTIKTEIYAENQKEAIKIFKQFNPCCEILAITLIEQE